ncbi:unnamed protein product [Knipowitschia caucasica]|uniref:Thyroglobulin type-1 domain-containing protein n=1 Tax=Knipowitschia caucasica TaxID=637954 RepID=A0AAV2MIN9_KNICA
METPLIEESQTNSDQDLLQPPATETRGANRHALKIAGITTLVCLLVSCQAFTLYMVMGQRQQIQTLQVSSQIASRQAQIATTRMKIPIDKLPLMNIFEEDILPHLIVEKQLEEFMDFKLPHFKSSFLVNLQNMKQGVNETFWKGFESWLKYWLIFQKAQAPVPHPESMTKCQMEASVQGLLGSFRPECDDQGNYKPLQCWGSTGHCWCVDQDGQTMDSSHTSGRPNCDAGNSFPADETSGDDSTTQDPPVINN